MFCYICGHKTTSTHRGIGCCIPCIHEISDRMEEMNRDETTRQRGLEMALTMDKALAVASAELILMGVL